VPRIRSALIVVFIGSNPSGSARTRMWHRALSGRGSPALSPGVSRSELDGARALEQSRPLNSLSDFPIAAAEPGESGRRSAGR